MSKDIKDYLHLYLTSGIEVYIFSPETLTTGWLDEAKKQIPSLKSSYQLTFDTYKKTIESGYMPILRPLSDMTDEERQERGKDIIKYGKDQIEAEYHRWMLSKGFDLFGLIDAGLAIDKTTITQ